MENNNLVATTDFCGSHDIEISFINLLGEHGLVEIVSIEEKNYLQIDELKNIEKMVHLHYDLDINIEGIEAISHLLNRIDDLHQELTQLRNKLSFYDRQLPGPF